MTASPSWENPSLSNSPEKALNFGHLGGTGTVGDPDSWFPELWSDLIGRFSVKSMLDVGCGVGQAQNFFYQSNILSFGIDCPQVLEHHVITKSIGCPMYVRSHDFTTDYSWISMTGFDLVWCCEVAEHIDEFYSQYFVETLVLNTNKVLALTAAPPGADGYHHVNCRPAKYWIDRVEAAGLTFRPDLTDAAKQLCGPDYGRSRNNYFRRNGMIFTR